MRFCAKKNSLEIFPEIADSGYIESRRGNTVHRKLQIVLSYAGVPLATTSAPELMHAVAEAAVAESKARAERLADPAMAAIERSETERMRLLFRDLGLDGSSARVM